MMASIEVTVDTPTDNSIKARFEKLDANMQRALKDTIETLTNQALASARANAPKGDTHGLEGAISSHVAQGDGWMRGYVEVGPEHGEPFNTKAAALEYGAHKITGVSGYTREIDHVWGLATAPFEQLVSTYNRTPNIDEVRYLRDSLTDDIKSQLIAAIDEIVNGADKDFNE